MSVLQQLGKNTNFQSDIKRMSKKVEEQPSIPQEFLDKHNHILDEIKQALNFIEPNYNEENESDYSSGSSHSSYESSSSGESESD